MEAGNYHNLACILEYLSLRMTLVSVAKPGIRVRSPVRALQSACVPPLQGFVFFVPTQGFGRSAAFALGFAVPRFQRSDRLLE